jgi:hypothetical protein
MAVGNGSDPVRRSGVAILEGVPSLFRYTVGLAADLPHRTSLAIVVYHLLGDVVNAAGHALTHYLPLTLTESFLQNSSLGTPYQKWAKFTNEDFQKVDGCLRRLVPAVWTSYDVCHGDLRADMPVTIKDAWSWFYALNTTYTCCAVNPDAPELTTAAINLAGWAESGGTRFLKVRNRPAWEPQIEAPPIVTWATVSIQDRSVIGRLHQTGLETLGELRRIVAEFAVWLRSNYTMEAVTAPHPGTLSDHWLG